MKIKKDYFNLKTNLVLEREKRLVCFSDLHYGNISYYFYQNYLNGFYRQIALAYNGKNVDAILIPGDLLFYFQSFQGKKYFEQLKNDLKNLSQRLGSPVILSYGNHDLPFDFEKLNEQALDLKKQLEDVSNGLYVLNNEQISFGDLCITGFSPLRDAYNTWGMPNPAFRMAYEAWQKCNFSFSNQMCNVLLSHENKFFTYPELTQYYGKLYENLTLILGGHLHDGHVPLWFQEKCRNSLKDYGIWEKIPPTIGMCRGAFLVTNHDTSSVILPDASITLNPDEALSVVLRGVAKYSWFIPATPSYTEILIEGNTRTLKK